MGPETKIHFTCALQNSPIPRVALPNSPITYHSNNGINVKKFDELHHYCFEAVNPMMKFEGDERWINYYSSAHSILLVGEGDFSFSRCLALRFGSATNITATSLDSFDVLINKYKDAKSNLAILSFLGASVMHGVDATRMATHPELHFRKFHRIIYNFPHAGFHGKESDPDMMTMHKDLVRGFLHNASSMLHYDGEVHVNHKTNTLFDSWKVEDMGSECSLLCIGQNEFRKEDYPGYNNKRGSGSRADEPFPLGACKTYRFRLSPSAVNKLIMWKAHLMPQMFMTRACVQQQTPMTHFASQMYPGPYPVVQHQPPSRHWTVYDNGVAQQNYASECRRIFGGFLDEVEQTFGDTSYDVRRSIDEALRLGYEMFTTSSEPGRPMSDFINILEELHRLSILRSERLRRVLFGHHLS